MQPRSGLCGSSSSSEEPMLKASTQVLISISMVLINSAMAQWCTTHNGITQRRNSDNKFYDGTTATNSTPFNCRVLCNMLSMLSINTKSIFTYIRCVPLWCMLCSRGSLHNETCRFKHLSLTNHIWVTATYSQLNLLIIFETQI